MVGRCVTTDFVEDLVDVAGKGLVLSRKREELLNHYSRF